VFLKRGDKTSKSAGMWKTGSEVMILGEMCVFSLIYIYVAVCRFPLIIICFYLSFLITHTMFVNILMFDFLFYMFVLYFVYSLFLYCFVYCFSSCI